MDTLTCPGCNVGFLPTHDLPAVPVKISRKVGRYFTSGSELMCPACMDRLHSRGSWKLPSGGEIVNWPSSDAKTNTSSCEGCGVVIALPDDRRRKVTYCSDKCRALIYRKRDAKTNTSSCENCGTDFTARRGAKYCSPKCRQALYRARKSVAPASDKSEPITFTRRGTKAQKKQLKAAERLAIQLDSITVALDHEFPVRVFDQTFTEGDAAELAKALRRSARLLEIHAGRLSEYSKGQTAVERLTS